MTASGAIDAAVEAAAQALLVAGREEAAQLDIDLDSIVSTREQMNNVRRAARIIIEAAAPVLLAAERERIAKELEKAAEGGLIFTGTGHEVELLKAGSQARAHAFRSAAAIARGSVAGKQASSNVD